MWNTPVSLKVFHQVHYCQVPSSSIQNKFPISHKISSFCVKIPISTVSFFQIKVPGWSFKCVEQGISLIYILHVTCKYCFCACIFSWRWQRPTEVYRLKWRYFTKLNRREETASRGSKIGFLVLKNRSILSYPHVSKMNLPS
jgi:hypothetical protein